MRMLLWLSALCLCPTAALADEISSAYTKFDLERSCEVIEKGDEYVYAGTWRCTGEAGLDIVIASGDDRDYVGFGAKAAQTCSFKKTFNRFNTALSPVEWRIRNGKPFAAIQRFRVVTDDEGGNMTWLVVTALKGEEACPVSYVAGSYPDANAVARTMADGEAPNFDCATDVPTVNSTVGEPGITLAACKELASE